MSVTVHHRYIPHRNWVFAAYHLRHRAPETPVNLMLLGGDNRPGFLRRQQDRLLVQRLDRVHVDHTQTDPHLGKGVVRQQRL